MGVVALLPESEISHVGVLQACAAEIDAPLLGAIFPALVTDTGFQTHGVCLLCFENMPAHFLIEDVHQNGSAKMALAYETLVSFGQASNPVTLLTIFDSMVPNIGTLMDQLHLQISQPPLYVGVNAGSETFQPMPCLFDQTRLVGNGAIGLLLTDGPRPIVQHDYPVSKVLMRASSAEGNRVVTIDGRPAFDVYQEVIGEEFGIALTRDNFYEYAVHFPFGVITTVDVLVRIPVMLGEDGSLFCVGEIAPNSMLRLLKAPTLAASTCVASICRHLENSVPSTGSFSLLSFYCAGRRMHFKDDAVTELSQLKAETKTQSLFGALSLGEIDSFEDFNFPRFHNAAIVCLPQIQH